jgi:FkbM family methyltransferase
MKLREFFNMLGFKSEPCKYGYVVKQQTIDGLSLRYADWLHPRAYSCEVKPEDLTRLKDFLTEGDVAIDIGAHVGDTTLPMAAAVGREGSVIAFEANPYVFETLEVNAGLNEHIGHVYAHNLAVTEESREYEFSYNDPGFMNGGAVEKTRGFRRGDAYRIKVSGVHLETFLNERYSPLIPRIKYIKVDAEGYDYYILRSIAGFIQRIRPFVQAEVMKGTSASYRADLFELFNEMGYIVQHHDKGQNLEIFRSGHDMCSYENFDIFCTPAEAISSCKSSPLAA